MKIVVLDGYTLNPGDLDWQDLDVCGELTVYERTSPELILERAADAELVLTNKVVLGAEEMESLPALRYIGVLATGVNVVDLEAARQRGIVVTNVPAYSTPSVAQHVFALLLELTRGVGEHARLVRAGKWSTSPDFSFWVSPQVELADKTLGIVGYGRIGQAVARVAKAFDMPVLVHTRRPQSLPEGSRQVSLDTLISQADIVSLHCPLTPETKHLINAERLTKMKASAYLINTGRGPLVDEAALAQALSDGQIAGAGLDVLSLEPPSANNPLISEPACIITPHIAWATLAARKRLMNVVVANIRAFLSGTPQNQVD